MNKNKKDLLKYLEYESACKFIVSFGGKKSLMEISSAGESYLCCNWSKYYNSAIYYLERKSKLNVIDVKRSWSDMDANFCKNIAICLVGLANEALDIKNNYTVEIKNSE
ncbi:MAG: hypothetical protein COB41_05615 [Proteobacteria bacterium]|nr:MAG: hypothetical protein COB41_05515 [Pseudomonadota bacterium]PCI44014.1 MAG: hypothetical protein COB41_05615 [Pseudomonadota bacterium]